MGVQGAGDVLATGAGVTDIQVGDAVFGFTLTGAGTYAETTALPAANVAHKPEGLSFESAATIPVSGTTALDALDGLDLRDGATVLINGVGGSTGLVTAQLATARGLKVIGTGSDGKRPVAEALGITFVSYNAGDVADQVRTLTPAGVDGVIDLVGGESLRSVACLVEDVERLISIVADGVVAELGGTYIVRRLGRSGLETVAALMVAGEIDAHITRSLPFDRAAEAVAHVEGGHATGNLVITFPA